MFQTMYQNKNLVAVYFKPSNFTPSGEIENINMKLPPDEGFRHLEIYFHQLTSQVMFTLSFPESPFQDILSQYSVADAATRRLLDTSNTSAPPGGSGDGLSLQFDRAQFTNLLNNPVVVPFYLLGQGKIRLRAASDSVDNRALLLFRFGPLT